MQMIFIIFKFINTSYKKGFWSQVLYFVQKVSYLLCHICFIKFINFKLIYLYRINWLISYIFYCFYCLCISLGFFFFNVYFSEFEFDQFPATKHLTHDLKGRISSVLEQLMILVFPHVLYTNIIENADFREFWADSNRLSDFRKLGLKRCARLQRKKLLKGASWYAVVSRRELIKVVNLTI